MRPPSRIRPIEVVVQAYSTSAGWSAREFVTSTTNLTADERAEVDRVHRQDLARARGELAAAVRAQDPDRHFNGQKESPAVIAAYDQVRAAEAAIVKLERQGRRT